MFLATRLARRVGPLGVALTVYDVWRRLPRSTRARLIKQGQQHGTRLAHRVSQAISDRA
jgi:hypothetical protein